MCVDHLLDALEKLPVQITKAVHDEASHSYSTGKDKERNPTVTSAHSASTNLSPTSISTNDHRHHQQTKLQRFDKLLHHFVHVASDKVNQLFLSQLLTLPVNAITAYVKDRMFPVLLESASSALTTEASSSTTIQEVVKILPDIFKCYLSQPYPACYAVHHAIDELIARTKCLYVTISACLRPMSEQVKLRVATDMALLEQVLESIRHESGAGSTTGVTGISTSSSSSGSGAGATSGGAKQQAKICPVDAEFR